MGFKSNAASGLPRQIRGTVDIGDIGGGSFGDIPVTGGLIKAQKSNASLKSIINVTYAGLPSEPFIQPIIYCSLISQGDRDDDNDLEEPILDAISPGKFVIYIIKTGAVTQNLKLHVTVTEE